MSLLVGGLKQMPLLCGFLKCYELFFAVKRLIEMSSRAILSFGLVGIAGLGLYVSMTMRAEAVPIERGTEMLQANVTVTWALE